MKKFVLISILISVVLTWFCFRGSKKNSGKVEKVLNEVSGCQVSGLDPAINGDDYYCFMQMCKVYEGLLEYSYLERPSKLIHNLAKEMPTVSSDGLTYTFTIKDNVVFQDDKCFSGGKGRKLTAHDFVYSIKRIADPKVQSPLFAFFDDKIKGLNEWRAKFIDTKTTDYSCDIEGLKALDDNTIQFTLTKPWPQFLHILAMPCGFAVPQEAVSYYDKEFVNHPVGTGAFIIENFNPQDGKVVCVRNPNFREKLFPDKAADEYKYLLVNAGARLPFVDKVVTYVITEDQPSVLKFRKGDIDIMDLAKAGISASLINNGELVPELTKKGVTLHIFPGLAEGFFVINCLKPPFKDNVYLRQAISMAFDRQKHVDMFFKGIASPGQSIIPPGLEGYSEDYVNPYAVYNLEEAKRLLAKAGYPGGKGLPEIVLDVRASTEARQMGEFFAKCMAQIGINVKVVTSAWPELSNKAHKKETMMHATGWSADYPDAENYLALLYKSDKNVNQYAYDNPKYDELYEKASVMLPSPERTAIYEELNKMVANEVPVLVLEYRSYPVISQGWIKNYVWSQFTQPYAAHYIDIDLQKKSELLSGYFK